MKQQLFQLLTEFEVWQDGHPLSERHLAQHDLVLAHLARLYGGLAWNNQVFGLCPSYPLVFEIQEDRPVALSELLAVTATGKLLVCARAEIPGGDNQSEKNGLFAIAQPLPVSKALRETLPEFPLYQVQLEWRAWQAGVDELVKTGDGLPLGRLNEDGHWDAGYIPPVMHLATDEKLWQQATEVLNRVSLLANRDSRVADLVQTLLQTDWTCQTPRAFWQSHCQCLVGLKRHPKLADDADYQAKVSELVSSEWLCWDIDKNQVLLGAIWEDIEKRFDNESERQKGMVQLMNRVDKLASRDSRVASKSLALRQTDWTLQSPRAFWQSHCQCLVGLKTHPKLADDTDYQDSVSTLLSATFSLSMIGEGLEPLRFAWKRVEQGLDKQEKRLRYVSFGWYATSMVAMVLLAVGLVYELKGDFENQLAALNLQQAETADKLSEQLTAMNQKQVETANKLSFVTNKLVQKAGDLSKQITTVDNKLVQKAGELSEQITTVDNKLVQKAGELSEQITTVDNKLVQKAGDLSKQLTAVNQKQIETAGELSKQISTVDNKLVQKAGDLSKQITTVDNKLVQKAGDLSKQITTVDNKLVQKAGDLSRKITAVDNKIDWLTPGKVVSDRLKDGSFGPEMLWIPAGQFRMGDIQGSGDKNEQPVHEVSIKRFAMSRYEVTFAEYDKFAEATDRDKPKDLAQTWGKLKKSYHRDNHPVINVSWEDAVAYADWLSEQTGHQYRLPTEAEWEYVARAGTETEYGWGDEIGVNQANCHGCGSQWDGAQTAPVGSFSRNYFGVYDLVGNVWEWTCSKYQDKYAGAEQHCLDENDSDSVPVVRSGSFFNLPKDVRVTKRYHLKKRGRLNYDFSIGFRLVRMI